MTRNDHEDHVRTAMGAEHVFHRSTEARPPVAVQGEGIYLIDEQGRRYIDACGGAVYLVKGAHPPVFRPVAGPGANERQRLVEQIAAQVGQVLERRGLIERDIEKAWLATDFEAGPLDDLIGHSITYRIAVGPRAGQKLFTLQTVLPRLQGPEGDASGAARAGGFSLHAGIDIKSAQHDKLERLCRYVSRPPVATERLALTASGQVRYTLKTPYRDGTTHIVLEPVDFIARLAALVKNLGGDAATAAKGLGALVRSVATIGPSGHRNSFANRVYAQYVRVELGSAQPRSLVGAYEHAVEGRHRSLMQDSVEAIEAHVADMDRAYGRCYDTAVVMDVPGRRGTLDEILAAVSGG